ncbi:MAG: NAD(P)H-binding protein [Blastocatellia bacterium]
MVECGRYDRSNRPHALSTKARLAHCRIVRLATRTPGRKEPRSAVLTVSNASSFAERVGPSDTFVQLVGVPHPSPAEAAEFQSIDLASARAAVSAAAGGGVKHFVYVSVAQPSPVMKAYQAARAEGELMIRDSGLDATILRPWYVLGPGHRWPYALIPMYWLLERIPGTRNTARRLGLVTLDQMVNALVASVESKPDGVQILEVPSIKTLTPEGSAKIKALEVAGK